MEAEGDIPKELATHQAGYSLFISLMKWGAVVSLLAVIIVVFVIRK